MLWWVSDGLVCIGLWGKGIHKSYIVCGVKYKQTITLSSIRDVLEKTAKKQLSVAEAEKMLRFLAIEEVCDIAKIDTNREFRKGIPEVILAEGKQTEDILQISLRMLQKSGRVIVSRCSKDQLAAITNVIPKDCTLQINEKARIAVAKKNSFKINKTGGKIAVLTAGTSDIPVAEEAKVIAEEMGCEVFTSYDLGVAGIHRLMQPLKDMVVQDVDAIVVVAGREGAMASVVAGMVDVPVIAVPTSNSFGFGEKGLATLMAMLQSCSLGLAVVNIDSGVSAGAVATLIANRAAKFKK
jgi:pyridinium-3,5-biscarboxylic acid mononucleotide synthase